MPRKPRLHVPGGVYHVMLRGNAKQQIFFSRQNHQTFEDLVTEGIDRFGHRIHVYCWMHNHVHLAVQVADVRLGRIVQNLASRYAKYLNKRRRQVGHVFQGRYRAILIDADSYLLQLVKYIHLNPVRAGLVNDPAAYEWSSHRCYTGQCNRAWVTTASVLGMLGSSRNTALDRYCQMMAAEESVELQGFIDGTGTDERIFGEDRFFQKVLDRQPWKVASVSLDDIVALVCDQMAVKERDLLSVQRTRLHALARALIAYRAMESGAATLAEVAQRFGRDDTTLSKSIRHYLRLKPGLFDDKPISQA